MLRLLILAGLLLLAPGLRADAQVQLRRRRAARSRCCRTRRSATSSSPPCRPSPRRSRRPPPPPAQAAVPIAPGSLGAQVLTRSLELPEPPVRRSARRIRRDPQRSAAVGLAPCDGDRSGGPGAYCWTTLWRLIVVLAIGLAAQWAGAALVQRPIRALDRQAPRRRCVARRDTARRAPKHGETEPPRSRRAAALTLLRRVPLVLGRWVLELMPVAAFLVAGHLIAATGLGGDDPPRLVLLAVIDAYAVCVAILSHRAGAVLAQPARLRLLAISDRVAAYAMRWIRRIIVVSVFGYAIAEVGLLLGLSETAHEALLKAVGLLDHIFLGIIVLQQRRPVRQALRAAGRRHRTAGRAAQLAGPHLALARAAPAGRPVAHLGGGGASMASAGCSVTSAASWR